MGPCRAHTASCCTGCFVLGFWLLAAAKVLKLALWLCNRSLLVCALLAAPKRKYQTTKCAVAIPTIKSQRKMLNTRISRKVCALLAAPKHNCFALAVQTTCFAGSLLVCALLAAPKRKSNNEVRCSCTHKTSQQKMPNKYQECSHGVRPAGSTQTQMVCLGSPNSLNYGGVRGCCIHYDGAFDKRMRSWDYRLACLPLLRFVANVALMCTLSWSLT